MFELTLEGCCHEEGQASGKSQKQERVKHLQGQKEASVIREEGMDRKDPGGGQETDHAGLCGQGQEFGLESEQDGKPVFQDCRCPQE